MKLPAAIEKRIAQLLIDGGVDKDANVVMNHLNLTNAPPDMYLTEAALRRAAHEAQGIESDFYCYMCGKHHEDETSFINCMHDHILNFYAGIPLRMEDEHIEKVLSTTPVHMRKHLKTVLQTDKKEEKDE